MKRAAPRRIGIDLMGSDNDATSLLEAAAALLPSLPSDIHLVAIGEKALQSKALAQKLSFIHASEVIGMGENPLLALRKKKDASVIVGLRHLKEGKIDALVSAGNTGALISASKLILKTFPKLSRPALLALMPTKKKPVAVLDVGANLQAKKNHLIQFAKLGIAYQQARGIKTPRIGLLNIGSEASKGTSELRLAYQELSKFEGFSGNIEGKSVFDGDVDVLVTDGFTGNVFLKTAEGIASLVLDRFHAHIPKETLNLMQKHLDDLQRHLHYAEHPGALLAGVNGTVVKCHGYSTPIAFANAIRGAVELALHHFMDVLKEKWNALNN